MNGPGNYLFVGGGLDGQRRKLFWADTYVHWAPEMLTASNNEEPDTSGMPVDFVQVYERVSRGPGPTYYRYVEPKDAANGPPAAPEHLP